MSIIVPALNEAPGIADALRKLAPLRQRGCEIVVADGGSKDETVLQATLHADVILVCARGRSRQMNAGACAASGAVLLFLHVDTMLPPDADLRISAALARGHVWGRFDVAIASRRPVLRLVAAMMNLRSRLTGIATGDQAMFMTRTAYDAGGGFPDIALMEDIAMSRALKRLSRPACLKDVVTTSARRWERHGVWRTIITMWWLRAAFALGADTNALAVRYGYAPYDRPSTDPRS